MIAAIAAACVFAPPLLARAAADGIPMKAQGSASIKPMDAYASGRAYSNWDGLYAGLNAGYGMGLAKVNDTSSFACVFCPPFNDTVTQSSKLGLGGFVGGGQIGYNWRISPNLLFGLEEDFQWSDQKASASYNANITIVGINNTLGVTDNAKISWYATTRARLGIFSNPDTLWYVTGGGAYGRTSLTTVVNPNFLGAGLPGSVGNFKTEKLGFVIGGGIETAVGHNVTAKIEYLYMDLGTVGGTIAMLGTCVGPNTCATGSTTSSASITDHTVRAGINFHF